MTKERPHIPRKISDIVLREFNHRCAKCGCDNPQLHHIDGNPSNNEDLNLIPLCPNCHLIDQHNPTQSIEPQKLRLFREFKDPTILKPQFHPLFERLKFLNSDETALSIEELENNAIELLEFILTLEKGEFYAKVVGSLILHHDLIIYNATYARFKETEREQRTKEYYIHIQRVKNRVYSLVIESLRFQPW